MTLLESVKEHVRIDGEYADSIITGLIETGKSYIESTTGKTFEENPLELLCLKLLVELWFDGSTRTVPHGIQSMLTHIEYQK